MGGKVDTDREGLIVRHDHVVVLALLAWAPDNCRLSNPHPAARVDPPPRARHPNRRAGVRIRARDPRTDVHLQPRSFFHRLPPRRFGGTDDSSTTAKRMSADRRLMRGNSNALRCRFYRGRCRTHIGRRGALQNLVNTSALSPARPPLHPSATVARLHRATEQPLRGIGGRAQGPLPRPDPGLWVAQSSGCSVASTGGVPRRPREISGTPIQRRFKERQTWSSTAARFERFGQLDNFSGYSILPASEKIGAYAAQRHRAVAASAITKDATISSRRRARVCFPLKA